MKRMMLAVVCLSALLVSVLLISGCGDDSTSPSSKEKFSFELTVVDLEGAPIQDLTLSRRCSIEFAEVPGQIDRPGAQMLAGKEINHLSLAQSAPGADPPTEFFLNPAIPNPGIVNSNIMLDVPVACDVSVTIFNWKNREMFTGSIYHPGTGYVTVSYAFTVAGSVYQPNGIFSCEYTAADPADSTILFQDSVYFSGLTENDPYRQSMGRTGTDGSFSTTDKGYFPSLQGHQPQTAYNDVGEAIAPFNFSSTVEIKVLLEAPPGTGGYIYWMIREGAISDGTNEFNWVFVPDDSTMVPAR